MMPKQDNNDIEEKDELINEILMSIDDNELEQQEYEKIKEMISAYVSKNNKSKFSIILSKIIKNIFSFILYYILGMIVFGLLFGFLNKDNKWLIFLVCIFVSISMILNKILVNMLKFHSNGYRLLPLCVFVCIFIVTNDIVLIFNDWCIWILYFIIFKILNMLILYLFIRRRFNVKGGL